MTNQQKLDSATAIIDSLRAKFPHAELFFTDEHGDIYETLDEMAEQYGEESNLSVKLGIALNEEITCEIIADDDDADYHIQIIE